MSKLTMVLYCLFKLLTRMSWHSLQSAYAVIHYNLTNSTPSHVCASP